MGCDVACAYDATHEESGIFAIDGDLLGAFDEEVTVWVDIDDEA